MNLTKIEAYGFKSFADKFEMKFDKPITAIVGPNGCGKSNVSDAVRWVLGEQSAKILRGKTMQDLIFNGTEKRKSMSYCEVSLFFDNKNRLFPLDLDEIIVSRKLYRSGESEYLINKNVTRLKTISDLLRDVGLGREGYSIVGQGRMDAILNARPDDRRAIFEEALGISKFRLRKRETENKLEKYRDNMSRLNDIMSELDRQLVPLKRESEVARKYLAMSEELKQYEVNAYIYRYDNASLDKQRINQRIEGLDEELAKAESDRLAANQRYQDIFNAMADADTVLEQLHKEELDLTVAVEKQSGKTGVLAEQIKYFDERIKETSESIEAILSNIEATEAEIVELNDRLNKQTENHAKMSEKISGLNLQHAAAEKAVNELRDSADQAQNQRMDIETELSDKRAILASFWSERNGLEERLQAIEEDEKRITENLAANSEEEKRVVNVFEQAKLDSETKKAELSKLSTQNTQNEQNLFEATNAFNSALQALEVLKARQSYLKAAAENYENFISSVKQLMKDAQSDEELRKRALGVVANLIKVDPKYEVAIEAALGGSLQNIVTQKEEDAKYLINHIIQKKCGRITCMPLNYVKGRELSDRSVLTETGCLGIASDIVTVEPQYQIIIKNLLGATVLVDTFENAVFISKKHPSVSRFVTLKGAIFIPHGTISGGNKQQDTGLLSHERELVEISKKIEDQQSIVAEALKTKNSFVAKKERFALDIATVNAEYQQAIVKVAAYQERISKFGALSDNDRSTFVGITAERTSISEKLASLTQREDVLKAEIEKLNEQKQKIFVDNDQVQRDYVTLKNKRNAVFDDINELKLKISLLANNIATTKKTLAEKTLFLPTCKLELEQKRNALQVNMLNVEDLKKQMFEFNADDKSVLALKSIKEKNQAMIAAKDNLKEECTKADIARAEAANLVNKINENKLRAENDLSNIDIALEALHKRMEEFYQISYSEALQFKSEDFDFKEAEVKIGQIKNAIARLGYINTSSIENYEQTKTRYDEMDLQMKDLKAAEEDQMKIIQDLTKEMVERFNTGFDLINKNFGEIFKELFAGGHARLTVEEEEDKSPLDYGIEIEAQPPGKRIQNISSLSGGERALTAVAILFAIIKLRPMPFCVLDEIEAPLDDANTERVAGYLRKFAENTQFVVITHKKPTMESADVLYGVTMEEKGVSKTVSVQLSDAIAQIED